MKNFLSPAGFLCLLVCGSVSAVPIVDTTLLNGVTRGTGMAVLNNGQILIAQANGDVKLFDPVTNTSATVLGAAGIPGYFNAGFETGLIGITVDPTNNNNVYLHYTAGAAGAVTNQVRLFTLSGNTLTAGALKFTSEASAGLQHRGGGMVIGSDGHLYVGIGDHLVNVSAQTSTDFAGSIVRVNLTTNSGVVFAQGLRNPFALSIQQSTGDLFINDVGTAAWEEINSVALSATPIATNFGWPCGEGPGVTPCAPGQPEAPAVGFTNPVFSYAHGVGGACAITGGAFYSGSAGLAGAGDYLYADFCNGEVRALDVNTLASTLVFDRAAARLTALAVSAAGSIYYLDANSETFGVLNAAVPEPSTVALTAGALLALQWLRRRRNERRVIR